MTSWIRILIIAAISLIVPCHALYYCPRPRCEKCLPADIYDAPGIGFDLTSSYGTSVVHYSNGTVIDVVQIEGNAEYVELMTRLAKGGEPILIQEGVLEKICFKILAFLDYFGFPSPTWSGWRWLNDKREYPVKDDINILSEMISTLGLATEERIYQSLDMSRIAIAIPDIQTLTPKIINKALRKAGLKSPTGDCIWYPNRLIEADTVYAANGYGLCDNYHDLWQCEYEFDFHFEFGRPLAPPASPVLLFVSFTRHSLYISITIPDRGQALSWSTEDEKNVFDFDLGLDRILEVDSDHQNELWTSLRERIFSRQVSDYASFVSGRECNESSFSG